MKQLHRIVSLLVVLGFMCFISPALGANLLIDSELNEIGAAGVNIPPQLDGNEHQLLSDNFLANISGKGIPGFLWPFQNVRTRLPGKRISWSSGRNKIDLGPAFNSSGGLSFTPPEGSAPPTSSIPSVR